MQQQRRRVARQAAKLVSNGDVVGLGTGRTANLFIRALGKRIAKERLKIAGVPTSKASADLARSVGVPIVSIERAAHIDITVDGADEVDPRMNLVKGGGGALLREKRVAHRSKRYVVIIDNQKMVKTLGRGPLPVEISPRSSKLALHKLSELGATAKIRNRNDGRPFVTDNGNWIADLRFHARVRRGLATDAGLRRMDKRLSQVRGVVDHGLFLGLTSDVLVGAENGTIRHIRKFTRRHVFKRG